MIERFIPSSIKNKIHLRREMKALSAIRRLECKTDNLRGAGDLSPSAIFDSREIEDMWNASRREIAPLAIPDGAGWVNPGDRRAIYYLISRLNPSSVLEIGTHIGTLTLHIASALYLSRISKGDAADLISVDIKNVNSPAEMHWKEYGTNKSPREMIEALNYGSFVEFITDSSLHYAANCERRFDFIFLDGDHSAQTVYQEIPLALNLLNPNGSILLHDYFPGVKPLWPGDPVIPGPFLAVERLLQEGVDLAVAPLGNLPWPTKSRSNATSLALLFKKATKNTDIHKPVGSIGKARS
jgi:predicted O-methyltransferase YrrM